MMSTPKVKIANGLQSPHQTEMSSFLKEMYFVWLKSLFLTEMSFVQLKK